MFGFFFSPDRCGYPPVGRLDLRDDVLFGEGAFHQRPYVLDVESPPGFFAQGPIDESLVANEGPEDIEPLHLGLRPAVGELAEGLVHVPGDEGEAVLLEGVDVAVVAHSGIAVEVGEDVVGRQPVKEAFYIEMLFKVAVIAAPHSVEQVRERRPARAALLVDEAFVGFALTAAPPLSALAEGVAHALDLEEVSVVVWIMSTEEFFVDLLDERVHAEVEVVVDAGDSQRERYVGRPGGVDARLGEELVADHLPDARGILEGVVQVQGRLAVELLRAAEVAEVDLEGFVRAAPPEGRVALVAHPGAIDALAVVDHGCFGEDEGVALQALPVGFCYRQGDRGRLAGGEEVDGFCVLYCRFLGEGRRRGQQAEDK